MTKYTSSNINIYLNKKKKTRKFSVKDVYFDTSKYIENKPRIIKRIPINF